MYWIYDSAGFRYPRGSGRFVWDNSLYWVRTRDHFVFRNTYADDFSRVCIILGRFIGVCVHRTTLTHYKRPIELIHAYKNILKKVKLGQIQTAKALSLSTICLGSNVASEMPRSGLWSGVVRARWFSKIVLWDGSLNINENSYKVMSLKAFYPRLGREKRKLESIWRSVKVSVSGAETGCN